MKKKNKKGGGQNEHIDFNTKMDPTLGISAILFFGVITMMVVQSNIFQTVSDVQNSAAVVQIPHNVATTTDEFPE